MSALLETLKEAGWVETTLGECREGDEVAASLNEGKGHVIGLVNMAVDRDLRRIGGLVARRVDFPVLRPPRPEPDYPDGTVVRGLASGMEKNLIRARGRWVDEGFSWDAELVEVLRVLAYPDGTTPAPAVPDWDPERHYPVGTVVESDVTGRRVVYVSDGDLPSMRPWMSPGCVSRWNNDDLLNPRVLFIPEEQEEDQ